MLRNNKGFTLVELMVVIMIITILGTTIFGISVFCKGNFWYSDDSVLKALKISHPNVTEIAQTKRHVFTKSIITVKEDGVNRDYRLNTNVLWNYEFSEYSK